MFYSLTFYKKSISGSVYIRNTWDNWHLIPSSRTDISYPARTFNYVDIPGRDGALDITDYLSGKPNLSDRTGTWEFIVVSEYEGETVDSRPWISRKKEVSDFLDGSIIRVVMEDLPGYYYEGRIYTEPNFWKTGQSFSTITISYRLKPYKYNIETGKEAGL